MTQPIPIPVPPKKAAGFWTPWGNVRVPDLDAALEEKPVLPARRPRNAIETVSKPVKPIRRA